jgi:uncharacterized protein YjbI with pentapeptide repeats
MVSGISLADGDPFLTKQNEPSMAVSSVNPQHLLAGSNDYRLVDLARGIVDIPGEGSGADSWVGLYKSIDGGRTWRSTVVSGCPLNILRCNDPQSAALKGLQYASDPTVRPGPYGTFFYSFIAGNRGTGAGSVIAIQRYFDLNNNVKFSDDPFKAEKLNIVDSGTSGQFMDKPWNGADISRSWNVGTTACTLPNYKDPVPAFNVYISYSNFVGQDPSNPHPQIYVARSTDCGNTFGKPKKVSQSVATNQGTALTIDPATGAVYVFWRQIFTPENAAPDAVYFVKSTDGGSTWSAPALLAQITPFEQETGAGSFRAEAFPTATVSVDPLGVSRVHVAWSQRGVGPGGAARIVMTTSSNGGTTWSASIPVDNNFQNQTVPYAGNQSWAAFNSFNAAGYGHQLQPSLTFAGGKLTLIWLDQRLDNTVGTLSCPPDATPHSILQCPEVRTPQGDSTAAVFAEDITDATPGLHHRHTVDVFGGQAVPSNAPSFATTRVSQYLYGSPSPTPGGPRTQKTTRQLRHNTPNLPLFANGTLPFIGDYLDTAAQLFYATGNSAQPYAWNINLANTVVHSAFTTNQDVVPPKDHNWQNYTPIRLLTADGTTVLQNINCAPGQEGMKNQNIYTAPIFGGMDAYAVVNSKYLAGTRQFTIVVQNGTGQTVPVTLTIATPLPPGVSAAGFQLSGGVVSLPSVMANVKPASSSTRTVWVTSATANARIAVNFSSAFGSGAIVLNPDPSATTMTAIPPPPTGDIANINQSDVSVRTNDLTNNDLTNNDLTNNDLTNNDLTNLALSTNDLTNNDLTNNDLTNNGFPTNDLTNNDLTNAATIYNDLTNNDLTNNDLTNNDLTNNDLTNNDLTNAGLVDTSFTLFNNGTTDVAVSVKSLMKGSIGGSVPPGFKAQLIVHKAYANIIPDPLQQLGGACAFAKAQQNITVLNAPEPKINDLTNNDLTNSSPADPDAFTLPLMPHEFARVTYRLVRLGTDRSQTQPAANEQGSNGVKTVAVTSSTTVVPIPLVISTLEVPAGTFGANYSFQLSALGGRGTQTWALFGGSLPAGLSLSSTGLISGTPTQGGTFTFTVKVSDQSTPTPETDKQNLTLTINKASQTITFGALGNKTYGDPDFPVSATASSPLPVSFTASGNCTATGSTVHISGAGSCTITAHQAGNGNYSAAPDVAGTFNIAKATPTVTAIGGTFPYDGNPHPATGMVAGVGGADLGAPTFAYTPPGDTTIPVSAGTYSAVASFAGNGNYNAASSAPATITISKANQTITFGALAGKAYGNADFGVSATASSGLPVSFTKSGNCTVTGSTVHIAGAGSCTITAHQAGGGNYNAASDVVQTFAIAMAPLAITTLPAAKVYGDPLPPFSIAYSGFVLGETPAVLTGTLIFATAATPASPVSGSPYPVSPGGLVSANYLIAFVLGNLTVTKATPVFSGLASLIIPAGTASVALGGTLGYTPAAGAPVFPTGSVSITLNGVTQAAVIGASGTFSTAFATATLAVGQYNVSYKYTAGDGNFSAAADAVSTLKVAGFQATRSMSTERSFHAATLLASGKVLVTGGFNKNGAPLASADVYDPAAGTFTPTANNMPNKAAGHTSTLLNNGKVLVAGGGNSSAQLYDPATNTWSSTGGSGQRNYHTAVLLGNGKVLIAGGSDNSGKTQNTAQLYDPATGNFTSTANMTVARDFHSATLLPDGTVLIAGGRTSSGSGYNYLNSAEIYDPATGVFTAIANMTSARYAHVAVMYNNKILIAGGSNGGIAALSTAEVFDPGIGTFTGTGSMAAFQGRQNFTATVVNAAVLAAGGLGGTTTLSSAELYQAGSFVPAGAMTTARSAHTATLLNDGSVLITGGQGSNGNSIATAELYKTP